MFGLSFFEVFVVGGVTLLVVGGERLSRLSPALYDLGAFLRKRRKK